MKEKGEVNWKLNSYDTKSTLDLRNKCDPLCEIQG